MYSQYIFWLFGPTARVQLAGTSGENQRLLWIFLFYKTLGRFVKSGSTSIKTAAVSM